MSLLSNALRQHANRLEKAAGERVTYARGTNEIQLMAIPTESRHESIQPDGTVLEFKLQDFIIKRTSLDFGDGPVEPDRKDEITWVIDGEARTFQVLPDPGFTGHRSADPHRVQYRIHTKEKPS